MECVCGHRADEHEPTRSGFGACDVPDCVCIHFEEYQEEEEDPRGF